MAVYVDKQQNQLGPMKMCLMLADTVAELHDKAAWIGMRREGVVRLAGLSRRRVRDGQTSERTRWRRGIGVKLTRVALRGDTTRSFRHRGLKRLHERGERGRIRMDMLDRVENVLALLDVVESPKDVGLPGLRPHPLKGSLAGAWAVTVQGNWCITWRFKGADALDVDLIDCH